MREPLKHYKERERQAKEEAGRKRLEEEERLRIRKDYCKKLLFIE